MMRENQRLLNQLHVFTDGLAVFLAMLVSYWLRFSLFRGVRGMPLNYYIWLGVVAAALTLAVFAVAGLYESFRTVRFHVEASRVAALELLVSLIVMAAIYVLRLGETSRWTVVFFYAVSTLLLTGKRAAMRLLLQQGAEPDRAAVSAELFRIEQYVEMVLSYQRLGSDTVDLVLRRVELGRVVRGCVRKFAGLFIMKKLPLELGEVGLEVLTDEKWLAFVIEQLLSNALKYTREGSINIRVEGRSLVIEDTGTGIAPEDLPRLGERGFTGYNGREEKGSTGLGLYLCRRVCDKLGHSLRFESELGRGTRAVIGFPDCRLDVE